MQLKNKQCPNCWSYKTQEFSPYVLVFIGSIIFMIWLVVIPLLLIGLLVIAIWIFNVVKYYASPLKNFYCLDCKKYFKVNK